MVISNFLKLLLLLFEVEVVCHVVFFYVYHILKGVQYVFTTEGGKSYEKVTFGIVI